MKKSLSNAAYLIVAAVFVFASAAFAQSTNPPSIEKGWNLISTPCDVSLSELKQNLGHDDILVFDWNGDNFVEVSNIERGRGYLLNSNAVLNTSVVCKQSEPLPDDYSKSFRQGWNLIGNPYHKAVTFNDMLGAGAKSVSLIYEYQGNKLRQLDLTAHAKPFSGYWVYADQGFVVTYPKDEEKCDKLTLYYDAGVAGEVTINVGDGLALKAVCSVKESCDTGGGDDDGSDDGDCKDDGAKGKEKGGGDGTCDDGNNKSKSDDDGSGEVCKTTDTDVTAVAIWSVDNKEVLESAGGNGKYLGKSGGNAVVTAAYIGASASADVKVKKKTERELQKIVLASAADTVKISEETQLKLVAYYSDGTVEVVSGEGSYAVDNERIGKVRKGTVATPCNDSSKNGCSEEAVVFAGVGEGKAIVTATARGLKSNSITISVSDWLTYMYLSSNDYIIETHESVLLQLKGVYASGKSKYLTNDAEWTISPSDSATIEQSTGRLSPLKLGLVYVNARVDGIKSNTIAITVEAKSLRWVGIYPYDASMNAFKLPCPSNVFYKWCYTHYSLKNGKSSTLYMYGEYSNNDEKWIDAEDIKWEVTDTSVVTVDSNGKIIATSEGVAGVRGYTDGVYSEWFWFHVYGSTAREYLTLEYSNEETIVEKGKSIDIGVTLYKYNPSGYFESKNVTEDAEWVLKDMSKGTISKGVFKGERAGDTGVLAKYNGLKSNTATLRVWEPSHLTYCDENDVNEQKWMDGLTIASVETDCKTYSKSSPINVRFLAQIDSNSERRVLDTCLDLYIYDKDQKLVRTFQNRNCSPTELFRNEPGYKPVYDYTATWDQKDESGNEVPAGEYTAVARYYILYCPVLKVKVTIK